MLITHLEWFANSNDALQSTTVVAQHTLSSLHGDFFFTNIYLQKHTFISPMGFFSDAFSPDNVTKKMSDSLVHELPPV